MNTAQQPITAPAIGQPWQGGIYAGLVRGIAGAPDYHLIVSDPASHFEDVEWGSYGEKEAGATCPFDGLANTLALLESGRSHPAAEKAAAVRDGGFEDWYLPARRELAIAYWNLPGIFASDWYWSSTQYSANNAWSQYFDDGYQSTGYKTSEFRAFAVRRFINSVI